MVAVQPARGDCRLRHRAATLHTPPFRDVMADTATSSDVKELPLYALLAYASRCARRAQPLVVFADPESAEAHASQAALRQALQLTEQLAAGQTVNPVELCAAEEAVGRAVETLTSTQPDD